MFSQYNMAWRCFVWAVGSGFCGFVSFFWFFLPCVAPAGKYSVWSAEGLPSTFGASGQEVAAGCGWHQKIKNKNKAKQPS
jgi:hypothetical protein